MTNKVLMVGPSLDAWGGIATVENNILRSMESSPYELLFVSTMVDGSTTRKLLHFAQSLIKIQQGLSRVGLCHVHMALGMSFLRKYLVCRMAYRSDVPYILHIHEGDFDARFNELSQKDRRRLCWLFSHAACMVVLSEKWKNYFAARFGVDSIKVLENSVPVPKKINRNKDYKKFIFLGRMCPKKGVDSLLRASALLKERFSGFHVYIAGDGEELEKYHSLASELGLLDSEVSFLGWVDSDLKERLFSECGTLILPSSAEGLPMCVLEAMAHGCVVISTRVGALPELIDQGVNGYLYDYGDTEKMVDLMLSCILNSAEVSIVASRGRKTVLESYSLDIYRNKLSAIYEEVMLCNEA